MHNPHDMIGYYAKRAKEYDEVYYRDDLGRRKALKSLAKAIQIYLKDRDVLELACGTGYWTKQLSQTAQSIHATDINKEVIEVAKTRVYDCPIYFQEANVYDLSFPQNSFTGGMAHFLFSHVEKSRIDNFLEGFHKVLKPGARVFISEDMLSPLDNPITKPHDENTYSERKLMDGSTYLILKNFYTKNELVNIFKKHVTDFSTKNIYTDKYFWHVTYEVRK